MGRKIFVVFTMLLLIMGVVIAGNSLSTANSQDTIYDDNSRIIEDGDSYSYVGRNGYVTSNDMLLTYNMSGMETLWDVKASCGSALNVDYSSLLIYGRCKLVLIDPNGSVTTIFEGDGSGKKSLCLKKGTYRIKLVGQGAKGQVDVKVKPSEGVRVTCRDE